MLLGLIYAMAAAGVDAVTGKFWDGVLWPYHLGKIIGRSIKTAPEVNEERKDKGE